MTQCQQTAKVSSTRWVTSG